MSVLYTRAPRHVVDLAITYLPKKNLDRIAPPSNDTELPHIDAVALALARRWRGVERRGVAWTCNPEALPVADFVGVLMRKGVAGARRYIYAYTPRVA